MNWNHLIILGIAVLMVMPANAQVQQAQQRTVKRAGTTMKETELEKGKLMKAAEAVKKENGNKPVTVFGLGNGNQQSSSNEDKDKARRKAINDYLLNEMFGMENPKNLVRDIKGDALPQYVVEGGALYELKEIPHNVDTKETDIFTEDNSEIYPGVLLYADKNLANGNPKPVAGMGYGRVDVSLDIDTGGDRFTIKNVENSYGEIQKAVRQLVRQIYESHYYQPARIKSITGDYSSTEELAIKAGCDMNFAAQFKASASTDEKHITITHIDDLSQVYYNVVVTPAGGDYSNLFGPDVTVEKIKAAVKRYNAPLVFVNQMSYGRRLYKFSDYHASDFKMDASVSASYSGASFTSSANITKSEKVSNTTVYLRGGDPSLGSGLIEDGATVRKVLAKYDTGSGSNTALTLNQYNQGLPMSFTTKYIGSQSICQRGTTGSYKTAEYKKSVHTLTLKVHAKVDHRGEPAGSRVKPKFYYRTLKVNNGKIVRGITHDPIEPTMKCYETWQQTIELPADEYIDGNIEVSVRTRYCGDWSQSMSSNFIDPVLYNGNIGTLIFAGTVGKSVYISESSDIELVGIKKGKK